MHRGYITRFWATTISVARIPGSSSTLVVSLIERARARAPGAQLNLDEKAAQNPTLNRVDHARPAPYALDKSDRQISNIQCAGWSSSVRSTIRSLASASSASRS
jgi:hypothetical protein